MLDQLHRYDDRLYFLMSMNAYPHELIITAEGDVDAFQSAESLVSSAPSIPGWSFIALKPAMGFEFHHRDDKIDLDVARLWFQPLLSRDTPPKLAIVLGLPHVDEILNQQSVDTAYTILEMGIGERSVSKDIARLSVDELPPDPDSEGYIPLSQLADYIAFHKRRHGII
ncbi:hypothetical protein [Lacunimicrobium album]